MKNDNRPFPVQQEMSNSPWGRAESCTIPWWLAEEAYKKYSKLYGTSQSLERLAERGGFGREELLFLLSKNGEFSKKVDIRPDPLEHPDTIWKG